LRCATRQRGGDRRKLVLVAEPAGRREVFGDGGHAHAVRGRALEPGLSVEGVVLPGAEALQFGREFGFHHPRSLPPEGYSRSRPDYPTPTSFSAAEIEKAAKIGSVPIFDANTQ
jgi:hypothetical protein